MRPEHPTCEHLVDPLGLDCAQPRLSWKLPPAPGQRQSAYQVLVASSLERLAGDEGDLWDSARVESGESHLVEYSGVSLPSFARCHWKVRFWDRLGHISDWSKAASWVMGVVRKTDWKASWIKWPEENGGGQAGICPWFRKSFMLEEVPAKAIACVASIGFHELYVNGQKVGDAVLTPSVSDLRQRALYLTHDITALLRPGHNAVAIWLAAGWAMFSDKNPLFDFGIEEMPLCLAQIDFGDARPPLVTDGTWRSARSTTRHSEDGITATSGEIA